MRTVKKNIRKATILGLFSSTTNILGMNDNEKDITQNTEKSSEQEYCYCQEICQEIEEEFIDKKILNPQEIWEQIEKNGIKIEKIRNYLKISFPEIEDIKKIKDKISINFETENNNIILDEIFTTYKDPKPIKNGEKITCIKKTIFETFKNTQPSFSFCIIQQKFCDDINIYFTYEGFEKRIYTNFTTEKTKKEKNILNEEEVLNNRESNKNEEINTEEINFF